MKDGLQIFSSPKERIADIKKTILHYERLFLLMKKVLSSHSNALFVKVFTFESLVGMI